MKKFLTLTFFLLIAFIWAQLVGNMFVANKIIYFAPDQKQIDRLSFVLNNEEIILEPKIRMSYQKELQGLLEAQEQTDKEISDAKEFMKNLSWDYIFTRIVLSTIVIVIYLIIMLYPIKRKEHIYRISYNSTEPSEPVLVTSALGHFNAETRRALWLQHVTNVDQEVLKERRENLFKKMLEVHKEILG